MMHAPISSKNNYVCKYTFSRIFWILISNFQPILLSESSAGIQSVDFH